MPMESGYASAHGDELTETPKAAPLAGTPAPKAPPAAAPEATEATFREAALTKGVHTVAIDVICGKLNGNWAAGLSNLAKKSAEELNAQYGPKEEAPAESEENW